MQKTILCITDFSHSSDSALTCAASLAHDINAHLTLLYTYRLHAEKGEEIFDCKKRKDREAANSFSILEKAFLQHKGIDYDLKTEVGFLGDRIDAMARKTEISFIVVAKDMKAKNKEAFDELFEQAPVPIIIAR